LVSLNLRGAAAQKDASDAIFAGIRDTFQNKILPLAKKLSPREVELPPGHTTHNADSLAVRTKRTKKGTQVTLFSQSGHGGYLEVGTRKLPAKPYMYPAFQANAAALFGSVKEQIKVKGKAKP
jgi:hypothetical protein